MSPFVAALNPTRPPNAARFQIHLKNPILIGKKKAKDIQFYREASDASFDETGNKKRRKNYHDEDELQSEQEERKRRADLNKYFKAFADKIAEAVRPLSSVPGALY